MATRADVAKLAGVSESTVSYAINGARSIKDETKQKIFKAIKELDYRPHFAAGALAGGKAKALALMFPGGEAGISPVALEYITGAANCARESGYHLILWPGADTELQEIASFSKSGMIGGVLLMEIQLDDPRVNFLRKAGVPLSLIGRPEKTEGLKYVDRDFASTIQRAMDHLTKLGHKKIAYIQNARIKEKKDMGVDYRNAKEIKAYAKKAGVEVVEILSQNDAESGRECFIKMRKEHPEITSVIGLSDLATIGFVSAAREANVNVPKELSVISINTPANQVHMTWPPLTTIQLPAHQMGRAAAELLIQQLNGEESKLPQQLFVGDLEVRGTTSKPPTKR